MSETVTEAPTTTEAPSGGDDLAAVLGRAYDESMAAQGDDEPQRDERGRFASQQQGADEATKETPDQPEGAEARKDGRPDSWSDAEEVWNGLSPEAREVIARREESLKQTIGERDELAKVAGEFQEALRPYEKFHAMAGIKPVEAVQRLLAAQEALNKDFLGSLPILIRQQGYDPVAVAQAMLGTPQVQQQAQQQHFQDPRVDQILVQQSLAQIEDFRKNPAYPHFEAVRVQMGRLIDADPALSMADAYDRAIRLDPKLDAQRIQEEAKKLAQKADADRAKKARAGVSVRDSASSNGSAQRPQSVGTVADDVRAAFQQAGWT